MQKAEERVRQHAAAAVAGRTGKAAIVLGIAAAGLWTATHGVAGVAWSDVVAVLREVTTWHLLLLVAIWGLGLGIYSTVLSAALPGLGIKRGLLLNLSGSAVANVVPLGGAVATALNWRMVRRWGHSDASFVTFCVVTNALDVLMKLLLPVVAVGALAVLSVHVPRALWLVTAPGASVLVLLVAWQVLGRRHAPGGTARPAASLGRRLRASSARVTGLLARQWRRLLPGSVLYTAAQVTLLGASFWSVGMHAPVAVLFTAAAVERLGTLIPITPGGTGIAEIGTIAWLVAAGQDPVRAVAGVLLYRCFVFAVDIPVGGILLAGWALLQRGARRRRPEEVVA